MKSNFTTLLGLGLGVGLLARQASPAADWPMYRGGPDLNGRATGSLPAKPVLLWSFKTQGPIKSSAAIVGNRVFIGSSDHNLYALDFASGKLLWAFTNREAIESSPLVLNGKVLVGSSDANLYSLEEVTGKLVWKFETGDKILGAPNWFTVGTTTNLLVGSYDFHLYCLDAATGKSNWVYETGNYINGTPAVAGGLTAFGGCDGSARLPGIINDT